MDNSRHPQKYSSDSHMGICGKIIRLLGTIIKNQEELLHEQNYFNEQLSQKLADMELQLELIRKK